MYASRWLTFFFLVTLGLQSPSARAATDRYLTAEAHRALQAAGWTDDEIREEERAQRNRSQPYVSARAREALRQAKLDPREAWLPDGTEAPVRTSPDDPASSERPADGRRPLVPDEPSAGFGADTQGGEGQKVFTVTRPDDAGSGSLRDAIADANRHGGTIRFQRPMNIEIRDSLTLDGSRITLDGLSAGDEGVTIWADRLPRSRGNLVIEGSHIIVRGLRIRNGGDGIQIRNGAHHILIDRVTVTAPGDGGIDITQGSHDVTVQRCYIAGAGIPGEAGGGGAMLIKYGGTTNISVYRNYFHNNLRRCPTAEGEGTFVDIRNNVVSHSAETHIQLRDGASANVIGNVFLGGKRTAVTLTGRFHQEDNDAPDQALPKSSSPALPTPPMKTLPARQVLELVTSQAGAPVNDLDRTYRNCKSYEQARNIKGQ